jgi:hypothetical protein
MDLPRELLPTGHMDVTLPRGAVTRLPMCRPIFSLWQGKPPRFTFGGKPLLDYEGEACFVELAILRLFLGHGWNGVGTHFLNTMATSWSVRAGRASIPTEKEALLKRIWETAGTTACIDVFAWHSSDLLFCEAKREGKDNLTEAQLQFIEGALACGIPLKSFLIAEWTYASLAA